MTHNPEILVQTLSRRSCLRPQDLFTRILRFDKMLPELRPSVCNWTDPINKPWNMERLEDLLPNHELAVGNAGSVFWKRRSKPKAEGVFDVAMHNGKGDNIDQHSNSRFTVNLGDVDVDHLVSYLIEDARQDVDIAQIHIMTAQERSRREIELFSYTGFLTEYTTFILTHWLPELPWGVVFGDAYVRLFGMECLLSSPAYKVQQLSDQSVYIQLSPNLSDLVENYSAVEAVRQKVKDHIGRDAFFDVNKAYPLDLFGTIPADQFVRLYTEFKVPQPGSTGFKVPTFRYIEDDEQTIANHPKVTFEIKEKSDTKYDDASWHYGGDFPKNLPPEAGMTHMAMYWIWAILSGLGKDDKLQVEAEKKYEARDTSPVEYFSQRNGEKLTDIVFSQEGKLFTDYYYEDYFYADYTNALAKAQGIYEVPDSWESFAVLVSILDIRLAEWRTRKL